MGFFIKFLPQESGNPAKEEVRIVYDPKGTEDTKETQCSTHIGIHKD